MTPPCSADYFTNHNRRRRFPWSLYHRPLTRRIGGILRAHGSCPRVLVVGCGLEPRVDEAPPRAQFCACDIDERAVLRCRALYPDLAGRIAVCPNAYETPQDGEFAAPFDVVLAKEVIEHLEDPAAFATGLARRLAVGGELLLTTPNYGRFSTLPWIEATVLEWIARRDGFSRKHIHPSRFDRRRLERLDVGSGIELVDVTTSGAGWALLGRWKRVHASSTESLTTRP